MERPGDRIIERGVNTGVSIDYSLLRLVPGTDDYCEFCYQVKKAAEGEYITEMFGWDEGVQREFFNLEWHEIRQDVLL